MNEAFYPYIFSEDLYLLPTSGAAVLPVTAPVVDEKVAVAPSPQVVATAPAVKEVKQPALQIIHAGNSSALCIVFWTKKVDFNRADQELLHKILQACKLNPADIAVLQADPASGLLFTDELPAAKAIVFCDADSLKTAKQAQLSLYQSHTTSGKQLLLSDPLSALAQTTALKANLWKALQALLGIG